MSVPLDATARDWLSQHCTQCGRVAGVCKCADPFLARRAAAVHHCPGCRCDEIERREREREAAMKSTAWTTAPGSAPLSVVLL